jgi:hypothetical protein
MLRNFPEIEAFFKQSYFTEEDLNKFRDNLTYKYSNKLEIKKALSLIDLFLLKFKLSTPKELENFKKGNNRTKQKRKPVKKNKLSAHKKEEKNVVVISIIKSYREIVIKNILRRLNITLFDLNYELDKKNIQNLKNKNKFLSESQFNALNDFFEERINHIIENPQKKEKVKQSKKINKVLSYEDRFLELTLNKPLLQFKNALGLTDKELNEILSLSININLKKDLFTNSMWQQNRSKIVELLKNIKEESKGKKSKSKKSIRFGGVYDEISRYGGLGKVIYIRTR